MQSKKVRLLLLCLLCSVDKSEGSEPIVQGDRALLAILTGAQETGLASFPRGELEATVHSIITGQVVELSAKVVWDGPSTYWDYTELVKNRNQEPLQRHGQMVETRGKRVHFWPDTKFAQIITDDKFGGYRREMRLRPDQCWFFSRVGRSWSDLFDIGGDGLPPVVEFEKLVISRDSDSILVDRHNIGRVYRIRSSLRVGANVVEYEATPTREHPEWQRGTFEWAPAPGGRWRLVSHHWQFSLRGDKKNPEQGYDLDVSRFDPDPPIAANRFDISSLGIPSDATVEGVSPGGRERKLARQDAARQSKLDDLAKSLRGRGFAASDTSEDP